MRSTMIVTNSKYIKRVKCSRALFKVIKEEINAYGHWLTDAGFGVPRTEIDYANGSIYFIQAKVKMLEPIDYDQVIKLLFRLSFMKFGIDSNPENFILDQEIMFIDYFPFLVNDPSILTSQFGYTYSEIHQRYFTMENVLFFLIIRLFKTDPKIAKTLLIKYRDYIIEHYTRLLPREKLRLLYQLNTPLINTDLYRQKYYELKEVRSISFKEDRLLLNLIRHI